MKAVYPGVLLLMLLVMPYKGKSQAGTPVTDHESFFVPGGGYGLYMPNGLDTPGYFSGAIIEYLFYNKINQTDLWGPSHVRFYGKLQIMNGSTAELGSIFSYNTGLDFSFERNPRRNLLIPYFGLEMGGMSGRNYGTNFAFYPLAGLRFLAFKRLNFGASTLYAYPVKNFDMFRGWLAQATLNFSLW
ncbi:MAG TPA: hypothetical protein VD905_15650 [Flavobacteriales bacterium]|nr:hypothetical protein [Flavobacteriales bacterium]